MLAFGEHCHSGEDYALPILSIFANFYVLFDLQIVIGQLDMVDGNAHLGGLIQGM